MIFNINKALKIFCAIQIRPKCVSVGFLDSTVLYCVGGFKTNFLGHELENNISVVLR